MSFLSFLKSSVLYPLFGKDRPETSGFRSFVHKQIVEGKMPVESVVGPKTVTEEEMAEVFARDKIDAFLHFGQWLPVESTNVKALQYNPEKSELIVEFLNGGIYQYQNVSIREAESFARAYSKGGWVWDHLRLRGKGNFWAFRKPYQFLSGLSDWQPQWMRKQPTRWLHGRVGPEGLRNKRWAKVLMPRGTRR